MPDLKRVNITNISLDLGNYRTVHQKTEKDAINTMIAISPDRFWSLVESLIDDGYHPTENIVLIKNSNKYIVKEGNRRIAALKLIFSIIDGIDIPDVLFKKINELTEDWKKENIEVPCSIYSDKDTEIVIKNIALIHAKGEKAGRDQWTAVAKARFNRDEKKQKESGLDLLEKYLINGKNLSVTQKETWSGDYSLTVLDEAIQKLYSILGYSTVEDLISVYPQKNKTLLDKILYDIGVQQLGFKELRDKYEFWGNKYGLDKKTQNLTGEAGLPDKPNLIGIPSTPPSGGSTPNNSPVTNPPNPVSHSLTDQKALYKAIKAFKPRGNNREKVVTLLNEMKNLKIDIHPHSFCFLLRSIFEISAKIYSDENSQNGCPKLTRPDGRDKQLTDGLRDIVNYMTSNSTDTAKIKLLHGAMTEIAKPDGMLSVTSLNQLVHNPRFSIQPNDICILFWNLFPLLEEFHK